MEKKKKDFESEEDTTRNKCAIGQDQEGKETKTWTEL